MQFRDYISSKESALRVFSFIREKLIYLQKVKDSDKRSAINPDATSGGTHSSDSATALATDDQFRRQIAHNFPELVKIDAILAFQLIDEFFPHQQQKILENTKDHPEEQFKYLDTMFKHHHDKIQSLIEKHLMSALETADDRAKAEEYMSLQKLHFRLLCQMSPQGVIDRVRQIKRNEVKLAPVDCLEICEKYQ